MSSLQFSLPEPQLPFSLRPLEEYLPLWCQDHALRWEWRFKSRKEDYPGGEMLWGKLEFARELSRQLVEIASIKKGLRSNPELLDRIERLEKSHLHLLRKLAQGCDDSGEKGKSRGRTRSRKGERLFKEAMSRYLKRLWDTGSKLSGGATRQGGTALSETRVQVKTTDLPKLDQACALCGRVLLSSVLAGEEVIVREKAWYHGKCAEKGEGFNKPGQLN